MSEIEQLLAQVPLAQIAEELGVDEAQAETSSRTALEALLGGLRANASDPAGALSLGQALGGHDGSLLGADLGAIDQQDGQAIVENIFGGNTNDVIAQLGGVRGAGGSGLIAKLLPILAPFVLAWLGKKLRGQGGMGDILGQVLGGAAGGAGGSAGVAAGSVTSWDRSLAVGRGRRLTRRTVAPTCPNGRPARSSPPTAVSSPMSQQTRAGRAAAPTTRWVACSGTSSARSSAAGRAPVPQARSRAANPGPASPTSSVGCSAAASADSPPPSGMPRGEGSRAAYRIAGVTARPREAQGSWSGGHTGVWLTLHRCSAADARRPESGGASLSRRRAP